MIITRLTLENYKQYRGTTELQIAEDATIGVVGANGVGKTTIFEAIEWCLYNPRTIRNEHIRPRGTGGQVRVTVQLTTADGGTAYDVERTLKRGGVQAAVYRLDEHGGSEPVVQGTRDVTDYISTHLIGLGHDAFVATFFTRQKELGFFGDLKPTERRREVSKLLGFETIKEAQRLIGDERTKARADADLLQDRFDAMSGDRDLPREIEAEQASLTGHREVVEASRAALATAELATADSEQALDRIHELRDRYVEIAGELRDLETRGAHAHDREQQVIGELAQLAQREEERGRLAGIASQEPALRAERERLETERERHERRQRLMSEARGCGQTIDGALDDARALVARAMPMTDAPGWAWSDLDDRRPLEAIDRLSGIAAGVDLPAAEARLALYVAALAVSERLDTERAKLDKYRERQEQLRAAIESMVRDGEPADQRRILEAKQEKTRTRLSDERARAESLKQQQDTAKELVARLEHQHFEDTCPTCGRPFSDDQAEVVLRSLHLSIDQRAADIRDLRRAGSDTDAELRRVQQAIGKAQELEARIQDHHSRLASSDEHIGQQEAAVEAQDKGLRDALERIGVSTPPSLDDVSEVEREVGRARELHGTIQPLSMIRRAVADAQDAIRRHDAELASLTDVAWDAEVWRDVTERYRSASNAVGAVQQIDRELARRPQLEHDLAATRAAIVELDAGIASHTETRDAIGFDPAAPEEATVSLRDARRRERDAQEAVASAERGAREAEYRLETLRRDAQQLKDLSAEAETKRTHALELDLMYREFAEFDKFVAQRLTPQLGDITSDIVAAMTDGKYDRVEFDEDYGIQVWAGSDEKFDLETFSGGERDAVALAARLALSRMVGSQAANPPGFLVLDEVFGSLDAERRERVLTLLGQHSHEFFRQMFIISHVDDVQQSPVFDTIWQVVQQEDGSSEVVTEVGEAALVD